MMAIAVITAPTVEPISLVEAKRQCVVEHDLDDALLTLLISVAREHGESLTRRSWAPQTLELTLTGFPSSASYIELPYGPVSGLLSIKYLVANDDTEYTFDTSKLRFDFSRLLGRTILKAGETWPTGAVEVRVRYTAGWAAAEFPSVLKQWSLVKIASLYSQRENLVVGPQMLTVMELTRNFADALLDRYTVLEG